MTDDRTIQELYIERNELRVRLACLDAAIRRKEHDQWREYSAERTRIIHSTGPLTPSLAVALGLVVPEDSQ